LGWTLGDRHIELVKFESTQDVDLITISFLNRTVRIKGKNLRNLGVALQMRAWNPSSQWPSVIHRWPLVKMAGSNPLKLKRTKANQA
jgi:hypothetical protein